jgi:hypothetical protein
MATKAKKADLEHVEWGLGIVRPKGFILFHNHVRHTARTRQGTNGFRAWFSPASDKYVVCDCGWRRELGKHYRVVRKSDS